MRGEEQVRLDPLGDVDVQRALALARARESYPLLPRDTLVLYCDAAWEAARRADPKGRDLVGAFDRALLTIAWTYRRTGAGCRWPSWWSRRSRESRCNPSSRRRRCSPWTSSRSRRRLSRRWRPRAVWSSAGRCPRPLHLAPARWCCCGRGRHRDSASSRDAGLPIAPLEQSANDDLAASDDSPARMGGGSDPAPRSRLAGSDRFGGHESSRFRCAGLRSIQPGSLGAVPVRRFPPLETIQAPRARAAELLHRTTRPLRYRLSSWRRRTTRRGRDRWYAGATRTGRHHRAARAEDGARLCGAATVGGLDDPDEPSGPMTGRTTRPRRAGGRGAASTPGTTRCRSSRMDEEARPTATRMSRRHRRPRSGRGCWRRRRRRRGEDRRRDRRPQEVIEQGEPDDSEPEDDADEPAPAPPPRPAAPAPAPAPAPATPTVPVAPPHHAHRAGAGAGSRRVGRLAGSSCSGRLAGSCRTGQPPPRAGHSASASARCAGHSACGGGHSAGDARPPLPRLRAPSALRPTMRRQTPSPRSPFGRRVGSDDQPNRHQARDFSRPACRLGPARYRLQLSGTTTHNRARRATSSHWAGRCARRRRSRPGSSSRRRPLRQIARDESATDDPATVSRRVRELYEAIRRGWPRGAPTRFPSGRISSSPAPIPRPPRPLPGERLVAPGDTLWAIANEELGRRATSARFAGTSSGSGTRTRPNPAGAASTGSRRVSASSCRPRRVVNRRRMRPSCSPRPRPRAPPPERRARCRAVAAPGTGDRPAPSDARRHRRVPAPLPVRPGLGAGGDSRAHGDARSGRQSSSDSAPPATRAPGPGPAAPAGHRGFPDPVPTPLTRHPRPHLMPAPAPGPIPMASPRPPDGFVESFLRCWPPTSMNWGGRSTGRAAYGGAPQSCVNEGTHVAHLQCVHLVWAPAVDLSGPVGGTGRTRPGRGPAPRRIRLAGCETT